jgi:glycosyltransferase involved in cell wall biosynthesis
LYKFSLTYAEEVWFLNSEDKEIFLEKDLIAESQAFILPSEGVNTKRYIPSKKETKDGKIKFLMIARVLYDKGFREYVEAAKKIKPGILTKIFDGFKKNHWQEKKKNRSNFEEIYSLFISKSGV